MKPEKLLDKSEFWRSIEEYEEYSDTPEFHEFVRRSYPSQIDALADPISRRRFLQVMAASLALAGAGACSRAPTETIVPYVRQPEEIVPGKALYFATAMPLRGYGLGLLVESHMGRPTKVEGNPLHPADHGRQITRGLFTRRFLPRSLLRAYPPR